MNSKVTLLKFEEQYNDYSHYETKMINKLLDMLCAEDIDRKQCYLMLAKIYDVQQKKNNLTEYFIADNKPIEEMEVDE